MVLSHYQAFGIRRQELPTSEPTLETAAQAEGFFVDRAVRELSALLNAAPQAGYFLLGIRAAGTRSARWSAPNSGGCKGSSWTSTTPR